MKIAVTGGMGFIGHRIVEELVLQRHEVYVVDFWKKLIPQYEKARLPIMEDLYRILPKVAGLIEPFDFVSAEQELIKASVIIHAGAVVNTTDLGSSDLLYQNVEFTRHLARNAVEDGSDIIFMSSAAVYGNNGYPNNPHGLTKALGERIMKDAKGITTVSLRLFNVFGQNEHHKGAMASVPWKIAQTFESGPEFQLHSPTAKRDFVPVSTVCRVVTEVSSWIRDAQPDRHDVYDVGTGDPMSYEQLVDSIAHVKRYTGPLPIKIVERPPHLEGRYQLYTCAGKNGVENLGNKVTIAKVPIELKDLTVSGLRREYGVD